MKTIVTLLCLLLINSNLVHAQDASAPVIAPLKTGQSAPFDGVELTPEAVATIIVDAQTKEEEAKLRIEQAVSNSDAKCKFVTNEINVTKLADKTIADARIDSLNKQNMALQTSLKKEIESKPNRLFWFVTGTATGVVLTVVIVYAASRAMK